jgi:hypothetical protein
MQMLSKLVFAAALGAFFGGVISLILPEPYAFPLTLVVCLVVGWFSGDVHDKIFGVK